MVQPRLRQLQIDNERYRASMQNSTQKLQAQIGETNNIAAAAQANQAYQFKYMQQPSSSSSGELKAAMRGCNMISTSAAAAAQSIPSYKNQQLAAANDEQFAQ